MNNKPNVLFIYPDQMRYDAMSNAGNKVCKTPAFDRLAQEGINFTSAYTSFPLCCPFRASIMTGKYAHSNGMYANHYEIDTNQEFLPELMNQNGYSTGWIGKWHLSSGNKGDYVPEHLRCGFQKFIGYSRGHQYFNSVFYRNNDETPRKTTRYEPEFQTDHLFEFIEESQKENKPFFAGICYGLPHPPLVAPDWYLNLYNKDDIQVSENVPAEEVEKAKEFMAKYYGLVACVDNQLTRIINYLDAKGLSDNTMIVLCSDHGELGGEHNLYAKRSYYEGSMHVPFIIKYPNGIKENVAYDGLVDPSVDIFPTILDVCGIEIPEYAQGKSIAPVIKGEKSEYVRDMVYYELIKQPHREMGDYAEPERGIRTKKYIYIKDVTGAVVLFDLEKDPEETTNVINDVAYADVVKELDEIFMKEFTRSEDDWEACFDAMPPGHASHEKGNEYIKDLFKRAVLEN